jgi:hypothetical protein
MMNSSLSIMKVRHRQAASSQEEARRASGMGDIDS